MGWLNCGEPDAFACVVEENRLLHRHLRGQRPRLIDAGRRRLAALAHRLGRRVIRAIARRGLAQAVLDRVLERGRLVGSTVRPSVPSTSTLTKRCEKSQIRGGTDVARISGTHKDPLARAAA